MAYSSVFLALTMTYFKLSSIYSNSSIEFFNLVSVYAFIMIMQKELNLVPIRNQFSSFKNEISCFKNEINPSGTLILEAKINSISIFTY